MDTLSFVSNTLGNVASSPNRVSTSSVSAAMPPIPPTFVKAREVTSLVDILFVAASVGFATEIDRTVGLCKLTWQDDRLLGALMHAENGGKQPTTSATHQPSSTPMKRGTNKEKPQVEPQPHLSSVYGTPNYSITTRARIGRIRLIYNIVCPIATIPVLPTAATTRRSSSTTTAMTTPLPLTPSRGLSSSSDNSNSNNNNNNNDDSSGGFVRIPNVARVKELLRAGASPKVLVEHDLESPLHIGLQATCIIDEATSEGEEEHQPNKTSSSSKSDFYLLFPFTTRKQEVLLKRKRNEALDEICITLIESGTDVNALNKHNDSPLLLSCSGQRDNVSLRLLERGANPTHDNGYGSTPIQLATWAGSASVVRRIIVATAAAAAAKVVAAAQEKASASSSSFFSSPSSSSAASAAAAVATSPAVMAASQAAGAAAIHSLVNQVNKIGDTCLHLAAEKGHLAVAKILLSYGANVNAKNERGSTPLTLSTWKNHEALTLLFLDATHQTSSSCDVQVRTKGGTTALLNAASNGAVLSVLQLLEAGARIDVTNLAGHTPLAVASGNGHLEVVNILLEGGASVNTKSPHTNDTPLLLALLNQHEEVALALIRAGADCNAMNSAPNTSSQTLSPYGEGSMIGGNAGSGGGGVFPLYLAAKHGHFSVVKTLIEFNTRAQQQQQQQQQSSLSSNTLLSSSLLGWGNQPHQQKVNVNAKSPYTKDTALLAAIENGYTDIALFLIREGGADVNCKNNKFGTPLSLAAYSGNTEVVKALLEVRAGVGGGGVAATVSLPSTTTALVPSAPPPPPLPPLPVVVKVNERNQIGDTALMLAADRGHEDIVNLLIPYADVNIRNERNSSALTLSLWAGFESIALALLDAGADATLKTSIGTTPLTNAIERGLNEVAVRLINTPGVDIEVVNNNKDSPIILASWLGREEIIEAILLQKKLWENGGGGGGGSSRGIAVLASPRGSMMMGKAVNLNVRNRSGDTPLILSIDKGYTRIAEMLVGAGCDPNLVNDQGSSALGLACFTNQLHIVRQLLLPLLSQKGDDTADVVREAGSKETAVVEVMVAEAAAAAEPTQNKQQIAADPELCNAGGDTPLLLACDAGNLEIVKVLIEEAHVNIQASNKRGSTAGSLASFKKHEALCLYLIEKGVNIYAQTMSGSTMLINASKNGLVQLSRVLLETMRKNDEENKQLATMTMKETLELRDHEHKNTALCWACINGHEEIALLLLEAGGPAFFSILNAADDSPFLLAARSGLEKVCVKMLDLEDAVGQQHDEGNHFEVGHIHRDGDDGDDENAAAGNESKGIFISCRKAVEECFAIREAIKAGFPALAVTLIQRVYPQAKK